MVALLIISHSARLAAGVRELAQQMAPDVPIVAAGGTAEGEIGTSLELIMEGLNQLDNPDGVVVLMDLGSAVMTAEMALDFLDEEQRSRVRLVDAPLVEGALAAAATAAGSLPLAEVVTAAEESRRLPKMEQASEPPPPAPSAQSGPTIERQFQLLNPAGLHARPAAQIVQRLSPYEADVRLQNLDRPATPVSARSLVGLLGLGARQQHTLLVRATGPQAKAAVAELGELIGSGFGEMETAPPAPPASPAPPPSAGGEGELQGVAASPGIAVGQAIFLEESRPQVPDTPGEGPEVEVARLDQAISAAREALQEAERQALLAAGPAEAAIFTAQRLLLDDPTLREAAHLRIERGENGAAAWQHVTQAEAETLREIADPLIAGRAADLIDVGRRVLRHLLGPGERQPIPAGSIVLADELTPSQVTALAPEGVAGIATAAGGPTSHAAILARALGIPAVTGLGESLHQIEPACSLVLNGNEGILLVAPTEPVIERYRKMAEEARAAQQVALERSQAPAGTVDGHSIIVAANVASVEEAVAAVRNGADAVGLLRTEFLYLHRPDLPTEEEQVEALQAIFAALEGRPAIVRTLDVGGDKIAPALELDPLANSFLGVRGLRLTLRRPELFQRQLRAILRAAVGHRVSLMFPMVTTIDEIREAKSELATAREALARAGLPYGELEEIGVMLEVPAAALTVDLLASEVDFLSVGSNDLVQYVMAAERTNSAVANLYRPHHPAILRLLAGAIERAHAHGCWVGLCGEMAGVPSLTPTLVGLGFDELSMVPTAIPTVKEAIREISLEAARTSARSALAETGRERGGRE